MCNNQLNLLLFDIKLETLHFTVDYNRLNITYLKIKLYL